MKILRFSCGCSKYMRARTLNSDLTSLGLKTFSDFRFFGCTDLRFPPKTITKLFHMCFLLCLSESKLNSPQFDVRQSLSARRDRLISEADRDAAMLILDVT